MRTYNTTVNKINNHKDIHYFISILLIAYPVFYPAVSLFSHLGQYFLFFLWLALCVLKKPYFVIIILKNAGFYLIFYLIIFVRVTVDWPLIETGFYSPQRLLSQFLLILVYYIFALWHQKYSSNFIKKRLIIYFLLAHLTSSLISIFYLIENEYAIRRSFDYSYFAVGDFNLVYTAVCIAGLIWIAFVNKYFNIKILFLFITMCTLVIMANYMTAIALLIIFLLWATVTKYKMRALFILVFLTITFIVGMSSIGKIIASIAELDFLSTAIRYRLIDISNLLINQEIVNSIGARFDLAGRSWQTFLSNPFFGVDYKNYNVLTVGHHTQWIDNLARFGLIGSMFLFIQLIIWFIQTYRYSNNWWSQSSVILTWLFFFILGAINNNMLGGLFICMFFVSNNIALFKSRN